MRRTAKPLLHRLTVHFSNKFVRAQVAARNSGDVVCHAHTSEAALRESWESTSDRHAARRIGTSPPAAAPCCPCPCACPRLSTPRCTSADERCAAHAGELLGERLLTEVGEQTGGKPLAVEFATSGAGAPKGGSRERRPTRRPTIPTIKLSEFLEGVRSAGVAVHTPPKRW